MTNYNILNEITNFREICMGSITGGIIYRGGYPIFKVDSERDAAYTKLVIQAGINCVLSLAEDNAGLERIAKIVPWYDDLLKKGNVIGLDIQFDFDFAYKLESDIFKYKLRQGFRFMLTHNGPYLIHCNAGRDRTGFVAAIIGLLCGASIEEVVYDYMLTYGIKYANLKSGEPFFATRQFIYDQINTIINGKIEKADHLQANIEKYFFNEIGLTIEEVKELKKVLTSS